MPETILSPRQLFILNLINSFSGLNRKEIEEKISSVYPISKVTLTRELAHLIEQKLVKTLGSARAIKYLPFNDNPVLRPYDLTQYFLLDVDKRKGLTSINLNIFNNLNNLFYNHEISHIKKINRSFEEATAKLDKSILEKELERFIIELSWKSSKIEGNTYSLLDTEKLIKEGIEASNHPKSESIMILNHKNVFKHILKYKSDYRNLNFQKIMQLHGQIVKDLQVDTGIRKQAVGITGTTYVPPGNEWQIREAIESAIKIINKSKFPLEKALITSALISYIQPFVDGNKRTGRMLANAILLADDFYPLSYRAVDESIYKESLILFYEQNSLYQLKKIFLDQYTFALNTYFK